MSKILPINVPDALMKAQDRLLRTPSIEDGNGDGELQGKIYTSDLTTNLNDDDYYDVNYTSAITQVDFQNVKTGNFYIVHIHCSYLAGIASAGATNPGFYGSELIKAGDPFTILSSTNDYARGIVVELVNIVPTLVQTGPDVYQYDFELMCMIAQGDPKKLSPGQRITWKRQMYQDPSTFNEAYLPVDLTASFNKITKEMFFYWTDVNQSSNSYRIQLRQENKSLNPPLQPIVVYGPLSNSDTSLKAYVIGGDIVTVEIIEPGIGLNSNRTLDIKGAGTGAIWATILDNKGSLMINNFEVKAGIGSSLTLYSRKTKKEYNGYYPHPLLNTFIKGLPPLGNTTNFYVSAVNSAGRSFSVDIADADTGLPVVITPAWLTNVIGTEIKTHDGVYNIQTGSGYNNRTFVSVKQIPNGVRAYWDPAIYGDLSQSYSGLWAWSVSATYDEINKLYTEWTEENYIQL